MILITDFRKNVRKICVQNWIDVFSSFIHNAFWLQSWFSATLRFWKEKNSIEFKEIKKEKSTICQGIINQNKTKMCMKVAFLKIKVSNWNCHWNAVNYQKQKEDF